MRFTVVKTPCAFGKIDSTPIDILKEAGCELILNPSDCILDEEELIKLIPKAHGLKVRFIYLKGDQNLIGARMAKRTDHYMSMTLLDSQFQTLEEPVDAIVASIDQTHRAICNVIITEVSVGGDR